jgi:hypothetical protein
MKTDATLPRRIVLRRMLLLGCGLCVPAALSGCGSGQRTTGSKMSQADALYRRHPWGRQQCSNCLHFIPESKTCKAVDGAVSPEGWCALWMTKA